MGFRFLSPVFRYQLSPVFRVVILYCYFNIYSENYPVVIEWNMLNWWVQIIIRTRRKEEEKEEREEEEGEEEEEEEEEEWWWVIWNILFLITS